MFQINTTSGVPIYEQLIHNVTRLIESGVLPPNSQLPSVRALATDLGINPNTVAKAYRELEARGFTYSVSGKGCFVREQEPGKVSPSVQQALENYRAACITAFKERVSAERLKQIVDEIYQGGRQND